MRVMLRIFAISSQKLSFILEMQLSGAGRAPERRRFKWRYPQRQRTPLNQRRRRSRVCGGVNPDLPITAI